jgi:DNA-binding transcriptional regulator YiaG
MTSPKGHHYTESGLDYIYLVSGYRIVDGDRGRRQLVIEDIDGLHIALGKMLISNKKNLSGREIRFLRQEMLMSQVTLAKLLEVSEQAINRWENGKSGVPKPAEALIRLLYREHIKDPEDGSEIRKSLKRIADLEDQLDGDVTASKEGHSVWQLDHKLAA